MSDHLAENLKILRISHNMTQEQVAEKCDVSAACVSNWEVGRWMPNLAHQATLAQVFGTSVEKLHVNPHYISDNSVMNDIFCELEAMTAEQQLLVLRIVQEFNRPKSLE